MPRTISNPLKAHLGLPSTTLVQLVKIKREDGVVLAFADHDQDISYDLGAGDADGLVNYSSSKGHTPTAVENSISLEVDSLSIEGAFVIGGLLRSDLLLGRFDFAEMKFFDVNWSDLSQGDLKLQRGKLAEVILKDNKFTVEIEGLTAFLEGTAGDSVQSKCRYDVGDFRCGVVLTANTEQFPSVTYTSTGLISSIETQNVKFRATMTGAPANNNWFDEGDLKWTSGNNINLSMDMKVHKHISSNTHEFELDIPTIGIFQVNDAFVITAGCDKALLTTQGCKLKFNKVLNHGGFPHKPTNRKVFQSVG